TLKVEGTDKVLYLVDANNPTGYAQVLQEMDAAQQILRSYTLGLDILAQTESAGTVYHLLYDGHGSTRALLNGSGVVIGGQTFAYDAYGNAIGFNPALALTTFLYSGEQFDQRLQMQYLRARYYDAATGRFNRLDPFFGNIQDPQSLHKYLFTPDDPINFSDPSGRESLVSISMNMMTGFTLDAMGARAAIGAGRDGSPCCDWSWARRD
ncbi:MAG: RHS repeat-associated core domain-containing protein, partial [Planctomycetota bacterium]|nr:RHS repeat-associated core domain-containing protein [Planctomycetota bacterium]